MRLPKARGSWRMTKPSPILAGARPLGCVRITVSCTCFPAKVASVALFPAMQQFEGPIVGPPFASCIWPKQLGAPVQLEDPRPQRLHCPQPSDNSSSQAALSREVGGTMSQSSRSLSLRRERTQKLSPPRKALEHRGIRHHHPGLLVWSPTASSRGTASQPLRSCWSVFDPSLGGKRIGSGSFIKGEPEESPQIIDVTNVSASISLRLAWKCLFRGPGSTSSPPGLLADSVPVHLPTGFGGTGSCHPSSATS